MKFSIILLSAVLYLVSSTEAGITTDTPFKSVTWNGGEVEKVTWDDDGKAPKLKEIGLTSVDLMAGGSENQVLVTNIAKVPATAKEAQFSVPKDLGPSGDFYFIKYTAGDYTSFSGTFSIENINGKIPGLDPKNPNAKGIETTNPKVPIAVPDPKAQDPTGKTATGDAKTNPQDTSGNPKTSAIPATPATPSTTSLPAANNAASIFPSFSGITTAAVAFALTYLY